MEREDGRKLSPEAQHERRKQVIRLHKRYNHTPAEIAEALGMSVGAVRLAINAYKSGGMNALKPKPTGRRIGEQRRLSAEQELHIQRQICKNRPEQLQLEFALWTREAVRLLVMQEYQIDLPVRTMGEYLKRWGFTPQRPIVKAYEQRPEAVQAWLDTEYPAIAQRAKTQNAEIHWGDETALVNTDVRGRGFQPKGQTPVAFAVGGRRDKLSMISTVTNQGKTRWMIVDGSFDAAKFIEFMAALIQDSVQKIFLIVDNLRVHHSKLVKAWVEENKTHIELFYLPSYSPELSPDERLNVDLKYAVASKVSVRTKTKLKAAVNEHMTMLSNTPKRVRSYFDDRRINYAA